MHDVHKKIQNLPEELVLLIKEYLPDKIFIFTNKYNYLTYHSLLRKSVRNYEYFIREMLRRDNHFVIETIVRENMNRFVGIKEFEYNNFVFKNYLYFLYFYCLEKNSNKCFEIIKRLMEEHGLGKNQHKKNIVKNIRWNN
jgi:c-di-AMP phosphodiesterase-like protein